MSAEEHRGEKRKSQANAEDGDDGGGKRPAIASADVAKSKSDDVDVHECWICLDAEHDSGAPLRRDCSCRNHSGYAHFPCLLSYAKEWCQKPSSSRQFKKSAEFVKPWSKCPNCKQRYMNELAYDLATELEEFVDERGGSLFRLSEVIHLRLRSVSLEMKVGALSHGLRKIDPSKEDRDKICREVEGKLLSLDNDMKSASAPLEEFTFLLRVSNSYNSLGNIYSNGTVEDAKLAVAYFKKCLSILRTEQVQNHYGDRLKSIIPGIEDRLRRATIKLAGKNGECIKVIANEKEMLEHQRKKYQGARKVHAEADIATLQLGSGLAMHFRKAFHAIEAERLITMLATTSKRVHGSEHDITKLILSRLGAIKHRAVVIVSNQTHTIYQALRYKEDGKFLLQGPITKPRNSQNEHTLTVDPSQVVFGVGNPVVCHGLKTSTHLNGKIGDIRSWNKASGCWNVHFEDTSIETCLVSQKYLRILFELPEKQENESEKS